MELLNIKELSFTYANRQSPALKHINISVNKGEFITLCGKSGCGKSTLLRQLKPAVCPVGIKQGGIMFEGVELSQLSLRDLTQKIGFVMQSPDNQLVCDKVWHELAFGLENLGLSQGEIRTRVSEMASFFGIQNWFYKDVSQLSGGQKQLLNLASVMSLQPSLLVLDEPTSQLDPIASQDFLGMLCKINKELGTTVILSEHRLEESLPISDRVIVMDRGSIVADGSVREVGNTLNDTNSQMLSAFPTPMKIYYSVQSSDACPVTVKEGRDWLEKQTVNYDISFCDKECYVKDDTVLTVKELWFRYCKESQDVLKGLSFSVHEGELYAIVGGNGVGKSTCLSAVMGINKPYRGKVTLAQGKTIAALPQNPDSLFVKDSVSDDLWEALEYDKRDKAAKQKAVDDVVGFCELSHLLGFHPYDLSGGEKQRAALAKVLLKSPDVLLLDEPTKGLDAHFKEKLAELLIGLQKRGVAIVMVSHDLEFCAKYADTAAMFFDGSIVSQSTPRIFFNGKSFYTTAANRMSRGIIEQAVLERDVIAAIGGNEIKKKVSCKDDFDTTAFDSESQEQTSHQIQPQINNKASKASVLFSLLSIALIPVAAAFGNIYLKDRSFYFTSLAVIILSMLPFFVMFEGKKPKAREVVMLAVMCTIAVVGRLAFAMLPQFKPVTALIIVSGMCFGSSFGFLTGAVTAFVSNFYFSQGPWTPWQMFAWGMIGFISGALLKRREKCINKLSLCIYGFLVTLVVYGFIMNFANVLITQGTMSKMLLIAGIASGFPLDVVHAVSTVIFLCFAAQPMYKKLMRIKVKYGIF